MPLVNLTLTETSVMFDVKKTLMLLLKSYGLWDVVEHGGKDVTIAVTVDGAELSWKVGQVTTGIKIMDP